MILGQTPNPQRFIVANSGTQRLGRMGAQTPQFLLLMTLGMQKFEIPFS
jgi:hypothetical protein